MNSKGIKRLTEFLDSECDDYGLSYDWRWSEDYEAFEVNLKIDNGSQEAEVLFRYDKDNDDIKLSMSYDFDIWQTVREYDTTVKYFWMKVSYYLFPDNNEKRMVKMNNFNWDNYIGPHMSEPLRVGFVSGNDNYVADLTGIEIDGLKQLKLFLWDGGSWHCKADQCKPLIKSISDLTDEEIKYILCDDEEFENENWKMIEDEDCTEVATYIGCWHDDSDNFYFLDYYKPILTQSQWSRLYSLHVSLDYNELIKNNQAVKK